MRAFDTHHAAATAADDENDALAEAKAAIALYRGELMPGNYDDWVVDFPRRA